MKAHLAKYYRRMLDAVQSAAARKRRYALDYWKQRVVKEGILSNHHYEHFYTVHFGLNRAHYWGKTILDIGCGPRGSLEWAEGAAQRIGLDTLASAYRELGTRRHQMQYVNAAAESLPFSDGSFDFVCSFNSLDHVDDLEKASAEIVRVLAPGGLFLLLTDVHSRPTIREPQAFRWEIVGQFSPPLELLGERRYERTERGIYQSIEAGLEYDLSDDSERYGVLSAKFAKPL